MSLIIMHRIRVFNFLLPDFSPLRVVRSWKDEVVASVDEDVTVEEVDAHNIVPVWSASKQVEVSCVC